MKSIDDVINMVDDWKGREVGVSELTEGLTNKNYKLTVEGKSYVARIPGEGSDIFIDREVEYHNTLAASEVGVGANIFKYFKPDYIAIAGFIEGKVMSVDSFKDNNLIVKAVKAIKKVNTEAKFISKFIMFEKFDEYLELVKKHSIKLPDNFDNAAALVDEVRKILKYNASTCRVP